MLRLRLGLLSLFMVMSLGYSSGSYDYNASAFDKKQRYIVTNQDFYGRRSAGQEADDDYMQEDDGAFSRMITFSENFQNMNYGDVIGHLQMEIVDLDYDIVYAENYADARERSLENKGGKECLYLYKTQDGKGLNASYIGLYADLSLMQTYDEMQKIGSIQDRYIRLWIQVGNERLRMDLLGAYFSEDTGTNHGRLYCSLESDLMPKSYVYGDISNMEFMGDCLDQIPVEDTYDKMVVISHIEENNKRILVAVNIKQE